MRSVNQACSHLGYKQVNFVDCTISKNIKEVVKGSHWHMVERKSKYKLESEGFCSHQQVPNAHQ